MIRTEEFNSNGKVYTVGSTLYSKSHIKVYTTLGGVTTLIGSNLYDVSGQTVILREEPITGSVIKIVVSDDGFGLGSEPDNALVNNNNLGDLADYTQSRINLGVYSKEEIIEIINNLDIIVEW